MKGSQRKSLIWNLANSQTIRKTLNVFKIFGGPGRDRTDDLFHAMEARSQLRHRPTDKLLLVYTSRMSHQAVDPFG